MSNLGEKEARSGVMRSADLRSADVRGSADTAVRVLVIDDSATARLAMTRVLERAGFEVLELPSAIGATRTLMRSEIAAVVADVSMPGLSGDKLVGVLRKNPRLRDLAIIIVSGTDVDQLRHIQLSEEVDATLSKSEVESKLATTVQRALLARGVAFPRRATGT